jgi:CRP-like cAMP-binding protein
MMELISRILDGSIPDSLRATLPPPGMFGPRVTQDDKIGRLEEVTLLEECSQKQLKAVAKITEVVEVPAGTVLAQHGQPGNEFYLIMDGSARVELPSRRRARLKPGEYFGEMSLLDGEPRSATVIAETAMRLLVIKRRDFSTLLREAPELTQNILATLSRRIREAERRIR